MMKHRDDYNLKKKHFYCINIKSELYQDFLEMSLGDSNLFLEYLHQKYRKRIIHLKVAHIKKTATAQYQPKEKYKKIKLKKINPTTWQKYWELRLITGYSISYIIRVFLEWEKIDRKQTVERPLLPPIMLRDESLNFTYPYNFRILTQYTIKRGLKDRKRRISIFYWDDS